MAPTGLKGNIKSNKKTFIQSTLKLNDNVLKCTQCGMTYSKSNLHDEITHSKFHDMSLRGRKWSKNWGTNVPIIHNLDHADDEISTIMNLQSSKMTFFPKESNNDRIVMIRPDHKNEVKSTLQIMKLVNNELNAPHNENNIWSTIEGQGKAFVYVKNDRAIGIVTIQILKKDQSKWMIYNSKNIVQNANPRFILGISRIWVCREQRLNGIATRLIDTARHNTILSKCVTKNYVAWSQPSESGAKLALAYNGIKHKSGEILIPCYI